MMACALLDLGAQQTQPTQPAPPKPVPPAGTRPAPAAPKPPARPPALHVAVRNQSGTLLSDVTIRLSGPTSGESVTDKTGAVEFANLKDGTIRLRFEREGFFPLEREVSVKGGQPNSLDIVLNVAPPPPPPPAPPPPPPPPPPSPSTAQRGPAGPAVNVSIPSFIDKNFIGRDPIKESILACNSGEMVRLLQLRDGLSEHVHSELDEVMYIVAGTGVVRIGKEPIDVGPGSLSVVPHGTSHTIERRGKNPLILLSTLTGAPCTSGEGLRK